MRGLLLVLLDPLDAEEMVAPVARRLDERVLEDERSRPMRAERIVVREVAEQTAPSKLALKDDRVADLLRITCADVDEGTVALALQQFRDEAILPKLRSPSDIAQSHALFSSATRRGYPARLLLSSA